LVMSSLGPLVGLMFFQKRKERRVGHPESFVLIILSMLAIANVSPQMSLLLACHRDT
jgi:hypothetical protein